VYAGKEGKDRQSTYRYKKTKTNVKEKNMKTRTSLAAAILILSLSIVGQVYAAYSDPPTWQGMTMLNISFNTATNTLDVVDQSTTTYAGGVPLALNTLPGGRVDEGATITTYGTFAPPVNVLDNTAFSRRLGWNPTNYGIGQLTLQQRIESVYGTGASVWINLISKTSGLESYVAVGKTGLGTSPLYPLTPYAGIFGTAGSDTKWHWDYLMDHNTYAVPAAYLVADKTYSATYDVYIGDSLGNKIGASTLETWTWKAPHTIPAPVPIPAGVWLLGPGLAGLVSLRKRIGRRNS
jgi:hypothetical protein